MSISNGHKAEILLEALPYIQKYRGKTIVVKYGGNAMIDEGLKNAVIRDIVLLTLVGVRVVVVHGGGPEISSMLKKIGKQSTFVNGLRYTDEETMDIVQMVLCGKVNKDLVSLIGKAGGRAVGLAGMDGGLFTARRLVRDGLDYGLVAEIVKTDPLVVLDTLEKGYIPVVSTVARGVDDEPAFNVNADTAAAALAVALHAEKLILLTDVRGLLRDPADENSLIPEVSLSDIEDLKAAGILSGGMIPKVQCMADAVSAGLPRANIQDGRVPHSVLIELLSDDGVGTMLIADALKKEAK